jgi:hypothetical protein
MRRKRQIAAETASAINLSKKLEDLLIIALVVADPQRDSQPYEAWFFPISPLLSLCLMT